MLICGIYSPANDTIERLKWSINEITVKILSILMNDNNINRRATIAYKSSSTKNTSSNTLNSETSSTQSDQEQQFEELKTLYELPEKPTVHSY